MGYEKVNAAREKLLADRAANKEHRDAQNRKVVVIDDPPGTWGSAPDKFKHVEYGKSFAVSLPAAKDIVRFKPCPAYVCRTALATVTKELLEGKRNKDSLCPRDLRGFSCEGEEQISVRATPSWLKLEWKGMTLTLPYNTATILRTECDTVPLHFEQRMVKRDGKWYASTGGLLTLDETRSGTGVSPYHDGKFLGERRIGLDGRVYVWDGHGLWIDEVRYPAVAARIHCAGAGGNPAAISWPDPTAWPTVPSVDELSAEVDAAINSAVYSEQPDKPRTHREPGQDDDGMINGRFL